MKWNMWWFGLCDEAWNTRDGVLESSSIHGWKIDIILVCYDNFVQNWKMTKYRKFSKNCHIEMPAIICRRMKMPTPHGHPELFLVLYLKMVSFFIDHVKGKCYRPAKTRFQSILHYFYTSKNCIKCLREMPTIFSRKVIKIKWNNNVEYVW